MRRRHFLTLSAASVIGVEARAKSLKIPLRFFTRDEALDVAAAAAQIFPSDDSGPGANEAGVVIYIDRQLAGPYGRDRYRYTQPPFEAGVPEQRYQGKQSPAEMYREGLLQIRGLHRMSPEEQHRAVTHFGRTPFFRLLRTHTIEGMFCDPMHGGNAGMIGWQLIGFPGPRMSYAEDVEQHHGQAFPPRPRSLQQVIGRKVRPSEDEA